MNHDDELYKKLDDVLMLLNDGSANKSHLSYPFDADVTELSMPPFYGQNFNENETNKVSFSSDQPQIHQYNQSLPIDENAISNIQSENILLEQNESFMNKNSKFLMFGAGGLIVLALIGGYFWYKKNKEKKETSKPLPTNVNFDPEYYESHQMHQKALNPQVNLPRSPQRSMEQHRIHLPKDSPRNLDHKDRIIETDLDIDDKNEPKLLNTARIIDKLPQSKQLNEKYNDEKNMTQNSPYPFPMHPFMNWNYNHNPYMQNGYMVPFNPFNPSGASNMEGMGSQTMRDKNFSNDSQVLSNLNNPNNINNNIYPYNTQGNYWNMGQNWSPCMTPQMMNPFFNPGQFDYYNQINQSKDNKESYKSHKKEKNGKNKNGKNNKSNKGGRSGKVKKVEPFSSMKRIIVTPEEKEMMKNTLTNTIKLLESIEERKNKKKT